MQVIKPALLIQLLKMTQFMEPQPEAMQQAATFNQIPENLELFHYTNHGGLIGMASNKAVWLSDIRFLNDSSEFTYLYGLFEEVVKRDYPGLSIPSSRYPRPSDRQKTYSFSLSEAADSLSQWRGYCPNGGYCFSYDTKQLNKIIRENNLTLLKCIYNKEEQEAFIKENIIGKTPEDWNNAGTPGHLSKTLFIGNRDIHSILATYAPFFKDPSFEDEKEWRIVKTVRYSDFDLELGPKALENSADMETFQQLQFRPGKNSIIPYWELSLKYDETQVDIKKVIVSPNPLQDLSIDACRLFLAKNGYEKFKVISSKSSYRFW